MVEEVANIDNVAAITAEKSGAEIIEQRKKKLSEFFKKTNVWVILLVIALLVLGIYIRVQPMTNHNGHPGLWDVTTNSWTLGPDLDPYLFLRQAKQLIEQGSLPNIDYMRNVPLGFANSQDTRILTPYMIALTYKITSIFTKINVDYAGVVFPVIMFALTIIAFFFFVREIFRGKDKESKVKANIIALISSLFMIIIPAFLSRTVAGIPEKESSAFFLMFLAFYLFLKAWKTENLKASIVFSVLAGISTGIMGLVWGGISYAYVTIGGAVLIAFILNKVHKKEFIIYLPWLLISVAMISIFGNVPLTDFLIGADTALAFLVLFIMVVHFAIWKTKIKEYFSSKHCLSI